MQRLNSQVRHDRFSSSMELSRQCKAGGMDAKLSRCDAPPTYEPDTSKGEKCELWCTLNFKVETCEPFSLSSRMGSNLSHLAEVSEFLTRATSSNFWGLACPGHCGPPSWGALLLAFCAGWSSGLAFALLLGILITLWIFGVPFSSSPARFASQSPLIRGPLTRLQGYLHEHRPPRHCLTSQ